MWVYLRMVDGPTLSIYIRWQFNDEHEIVSQGIDFGTQFQTNPFSEMR